MAGTIFKIRFFSTFTSSFYQLCLLWIIRFLRISLNSNSFFFFRYENIGIREWIVSQKSLGVRKLVNILWGKYSDYVARYRYLYNAHDDTHFTSHRILHVRTITFFFQHAFLGSNCELGDTDCCHLRYSKGSQIHQWKNDFWLVQWMIFEHILSCSFLERDRYLKKFFVRFL